MYIDDKYLEDFYCKRFKTSCDLCQSRCEDGELDCVKCNNSISIIIKDYENN